MDIQLFQPEEIPRGEKAALDLEVAFQASGTAVTLKALVVQGRQEGKSIVVIGGIHGDEYEGPRAVQSLYQELDPGEMSGRFVGIPVSNPPAFEAGTRSSPIDDRNLARVFPGSAEGSISEQIAFALLEYVFPHGDLLLDHHSGGVNYACPLTSGYYLLEGEIGRVSREAAMAFGAHFVIGSALNQGRSISEAVRHKKIPSIYSETTGGGGVCPEDLLAYIRGTRNVMKYLGILPGRPEEGKEAVCIEARTPGRDFDKAINCHHSGLLESAVQPGEQVERGQLLATVHALDGHVIEEIRSDMAGVVAGLRRFSRIHAGELVALVT